jgi:hypothetical protein
LRLLAEEKGRIYSLKQQLQEKRVFYDGAHGKLKVKQDDYVETNFNIRPLKKGLLYKDQHSRRAGPWLSMIFANSALSHLLFK